MALTLKDISRARDGSALPALSDGTTNSRSVLPGCRCSRAASCWSIMTACGSRASNTRPDSIRTRSPVTPNESLGLEKVSTTVPDGPCGPGSSVSYELATDRPATCGRRLSRV